MKFFFSVTCKRDWEIFAMHNLQVVDINAARGFVPIHRGKGAKDRYLPLPPSTLRLLRSYWSTHKHPSLLFPGDGRNRTLAKGVRVAALARSVPFTISATDAGENTGSVVRVAIGTVRIVVTRKLSCGLKSSPPS